MSLYRLVACRRLGISSSNAGSTVKFKTGHLTRWQSSGAPRKGGTLKRLAIGLAVTGAAAGGVLAYSNYNPAFKSQVNDIVPGFSSLSDKAADVWVDMTDYFNPKPQGNERKEEFVIEHNQAKVKARLDELKSKPAPPPSQKKPKPESADKKVDTSVVVDDKKIGGAGGSTEVKPKPEKKPEKKSVSKSDKGKEQPSKGSGAKSGVKEVAKEKPKKPSSEKPAAVDPKDKKATPQKGSVSPPEDVSPSVPDPKPTASLQTPGAKAAEEKPTKPSAKAAEEKPTKPKAKEDTVKPAVTEELQKSPSKDPIVGADTMPNPAEIVLLEEACKTFTSNVNRVHQAQESFAKSWDDLFKKLNCPHCDEGQKEKKVAEAQSVAAAAGAELKSASEEFHVGTQRLKSLVNKAAEQSFKEAYTTACDMATKEVGVGLMLILMMADAQMVQADRKDIQESKDMLQKELQAAASWISPEPKEGVVLALQKKMESLNRQLKESEAQQEKILALTLDAQKKSLDELAKSKLDRALKESEVKQHQQFVKETNKISASYNSMLREQLRLEHESHLKELETALKSQAKKLGLKWSSEMDLRLFMQEGFYQTELARALARLGGLHATVEGVLRAGQKTVELQTLRNSCDTLSDTLDRIDRTPDVADRYTLGAEVLSLRKAVGQDPFITTVLDAIPPQAIAGEGIQSAASLRERFAKVKRICRRVALVPETGAGLGTYALSYLQSLLTIRAWFPDTSSTSTSDPSEMHVYQLLHQADARLRRGDLEGAVHYMNHLQGEARNIARDWLVDARLCLETRQAVELVETYMAASAARPVLNIDDNQTE